MKGEPEFYGHRVVQPYRNPTDKRIRKLIHEEGKMGTNLYNWWVVNLCKNVSKDKKEYSNQIPEALLERIILCTTNEGDLVADPFSGTFSTSRTAMRLGRHAWGCDLNPEVVQWRPTKGEFTKHPEIPEQQFDKEYPLYHLLEAGLTLGQFEKLAIGLIKDPDIPVKVLARAIGLKTATTLRENLGIKDAKVQMSLSGFIEATTEPQSDNNVEKPKDTNKNHSPQVDDDCISSDDREALKKELKISGDPFDIALLKKRQHNLKRIKAGFFGIDDTLTTRRWNGNNPNTNPITSIREEHHDDITQWMIEKTVLFNSGDYEIAALRPGKEAHKNYESKSYYDTSGKRTGSGKKTIKQNEFDFLPVILDGDENVARRLVYETHSSFRRQLNAEELRALAMDNGIDVYKSDAELTQAIIKTLKSEPALKRFIQKLGGNVNPKDTKNDLEENVEDLLESLSRDELIIHTKHPQNCSARAVFLAKTELKEKCDQHKLKSPEPKVLGYTPWTLEHIAQGLEDIKKKGPCGILALKIIGCIFVRMAHMLDHKKTQKKPFFIYEFPPETLRILRLLLPDGIMITNNSPKESKKDPEVSAESYVPIDIFLRFMDLLANNEDVKSDWKGHTELQFADNGEHTPIGRTNTLLTYATFIANFCNPLKNDFSKLVFQYQRTQNSPMPVDFYKRNFDFL